VMFGCGPAPACTYTATLKQLDVDRRSLPPSPSVMSHIVTAQVLYVEARDDLPYTPAYLPFMTSRSPRLARRGGATLTVPRRSGDTPRVSRGPTFPPPSRPTRKLTCQPTDLRPPLRLYFVSRPRTAPVAFEVRKQPEADAPHRTAALSNARRVDPRSAGGTCICRCCVSTAHRRLVSTVNPTACALAPLVVDQVARVSRCLRRTTPPPTPTPPHAPPRARWPYSGWVMSCSPARRTAEPRLFTRFAVRF